MFFKKKEPYGYRHQKMYAVMNKEPKHLERINASFEDTQGHLFLH